MSVLPAAGCGIIGVLLLIFVGNDLRRFLGAIGYGVLSLIAAAVSLQWIVDVLTGLHGERDYPIGSPFLLYLLACGWGAIAFLAGLLGRQHSAGTSA
jgi:hypothetical protein